jgi:putative ABC transport system ATP-binding protein
MIEIFGLCKTFRSGRRQVQALDHISMEVDKGSLFVIAGRSGSGKTTLLNCIGTLDKPQKGRITCDGTEVTALPDRAAARFRREQIGFVFQSANLVSYLTVEENIGLPLALNHRPASEQKNRVGTLLDMIGMTGMGPAMPQELSGGETQRVAFARAIAHTPQILLADEPTASLDTETADRLIHLMRRLIDEHGCTLIVATHDPDMIASAGNTLYLKDGRKADGL